MAMEKVLLHTCCAPCSSAIIEWMLANEWQPTIYYSNPNIYPEEEYLIRMRECQRYADSLGIEMVVDEYDHKAWQDYVKGLENEPERGGRCLQCFRLRLLRTARYAISHGYTVMTTTLASSRWKSLDQINAAGTWAVATALAEAGLAPTPDEVGLAPTPVEVASSSEVTDPSATAATGAQLVWWDRNWRKGGLQQRRQEIIKEYNFYNQLYCGCEFSFRKD